MKKIVWTAGIVMLSLICIGQPKSLNDLKGKWEIIANGETARLDIQDSSNIYLTYGGETRKIFDVKTDFKKKPIWFDFSTNDTSGVVHIKSLLEITSDNLLKWQLFIDEDRTPYFTSSRGEIMFLRKHVATSPVATQ